eukprot:jgi/Phyca11/503422/fgenesh2_kg.PHYCAscaffold_3_\
MNPTFNAKPKAKFSSRNLNAAFKAPLRTKPLPDHAAGSLQRPNNRLLVLGRAAVAAPAPLNTLSLKRESQVDDVHVSLVPAGSNWAEKQQNQQEEENPESANVVPSTIASEEAWTPENVAEHLHTSSAPVRLETKVERSGRWGDDAVENDIVQSNIRRQMQKEREFPDLKEAAEELQVHHGQGHAFAVDRSPSMGPQQSGQHHGRATGRWAQFAKHGEMHRSIQDNRWSQDRYGRGEDDRWSRDCYGRGEDNYWARGRYNHDEDDRWSRGHYSRYDDGYGRERRSYESNNNTVSPIPNDSHTHFSSSDARFDMVASGDRDRVLSHSPHRMNLSSRQYGHRDERSSSPASLEDFHFHGHDANRTLNPPLMAAEAKTMNWRKVSSSEHSPDDGSEAPRHSTNACKPRFSRKVELTAAQTPTVVPSDKAVVRQVADGSNGAVEVVTDQQEGIVVNHESGGFKTVKSRRTVISEKKKSRQRLVSSETIASKTEEKKPAHAFVAKNTGERTKGGQVQETFKPASTVQARSKSRGKTTNAGQTLKDKKPRAKQQKYSVKQPGSSPKPMEQVPGEAPTETVVVTKRQQYVKVSPATEAKQEQKLHREKPAKRNSTCSTKPTGSERKSSSTRKQEPESKRVVEVSTTKPRAPASKFKPKQVRQVYVVKTPAPVSSMSTAA